MPATNFTPIQLYRTNTASTTAPSAGNLNAGELAINYNDGGMILFAKNTTGTVIKLMNNPANLLYPTADGTNGQTIRTNGSGTLSFGTLDVAGGGTGATTLTANNVILGNGTSAVQFVAPGANGNVLTSNGTTWTSAAASGGSSTLTISDKTGAYTVVSGDAGKVINCTSSGFTISLTAAATLGSGFNCQIWNSASSGNITIDPNASEPIPFSTTYVLGPGQMATIVCTGAKFNVIAGTMSNYIGSVVIGQQASVNNTNSAAVGYQSAAYGNNSAAFGSGAAANDNRALAVGYGAQANTAQSSAIGQNSSQAGSVADGSGAMSLNGSYASGTDSFAAAIGNNTSSYGATGANSVAIGYIAKATSFYAVSIGWGNTAGNRSLAIGGNASTAGDNSVCVGTWQSNISEAYSAAIGGGNASDRGIQNRWAYGLVSAPGLGAAQGGLHVLYAQTTDATATVLISNSSPASTGNQVILPNNSAYAFTGTVVARRQASAGTQSAAWKVEGLIRREGSAGTTTLVASTVTAISNAPGWTLALSADTTNGGLAVTATGAAATNIRWVATIDSSEVIYA